MMVCIPTSFLVISLMANTFAAENSEQIYGEERQITQGPGGRILTNFGVWSSDSEWLVYDVRSDPAGDVFDGDRIEAVHRRTGEVRLIYRSKNSAHCGVATWRANDTLVAFILGPENPTEDWKYGLSHRQGVVADMRAPGIVRNLDARDLISPPTAGALRGGSHVHIWDAAGEWLVFTYNDALTESSIRDIGVAIPGYVVRAKNGHARNHDGEWFSSIVTTTTANPQPGTDEIRRACEECWIGRNGYRRADGRSQKRSIAFQGHIVTSAGSSVTEVFIADLSEELPAAAFRSSEVTSEGRLRPMSGVVQRRLTRTEERRYPGIQGVRHWLRSSPSGDQIALLMKDDDGVSQICTVSPATGELRQLTRNQSDISSTFTWSPNGLWIAHGMAGRVCLTSSSTGKTYPVTSRRDPNQAPAPTAGEMRPESCVISPDGSSIAFVRSRSEGEGRGTVNQICVVELEEPLN
jgi:hypothetical protein